LIEKILFYSGRRPLARVGLDVYKEVNKIGKRVEKFEIADDEQLIGCILDKGELGDLYGITWLKIKLPKMHSIEVGEH
jgi:hypothetical protein